jgi:hypothetical protein
MACFPHTTCGASLTEEGEDSNGHLAYSGRYSSLVLLWSQS